MLFVVFVSIFILTMSTEGRAVSVFIPKFEECGTPFEHKQAVLAAARLSDTKHNYDSGLLNLVLGPEKAELLYPGQANYDFNTMNHPGPAQAAPQGAGFAVLQTFYDNKC